VTAYCPDAGDIVWLDFVQSVADEQAGLRPELVLSPRAFNQLMGRCMACPITIRDRDWSFEPNQREAGTLRTALAPKQTLVGFQRVHLNPGETRHISFQLDSRTLSQVDGSGTRAVTPGKYKLSLGSSQFNGDLVSGTVSAPFTIDGTQQLPR
jgi:hypothetical protein